MIRKVRARKEWKNMKAGDLPAGVRLILIQKQLHLNVQSYRGRQTNPRSDKGFHFVPGRSS